MSLASTPVLTNGQQSSATKLNSAFQTIRSQGTDILSLLSEIQLTTLVDYDRRQSALASKQQRAARVKASEVAALFVVSDFVSINQGLTTATVRADTASATLRERRVPSTALVVSTAFSASIGSVNALNQDQTLFSVFSDTTPTGTFTLELQQAVDLSVLTIELAAMASSPEVTVQVSADGLVYTPAANVSLNGDVLNAWFPSSQVQYIQIILTPSHADNLGGNVYTFGITDFSATTVAYNLVSDIYFRPVTLSPRSQFLRFSAQGTGSLVYNLLLDNGQPGASYVAVVDGGAIQVPGVSATTTDNVAIGVDGVLASPLPADLYIDSLSVIDTTTGLSIAVVEGFSPTDLHLASLQTPIAAVNGSTVTILPVPSATTDVYSISYLSGPSSINATLLVHLSTNDRTQTPVFKGAALEDQ